MSHDANTLLSPGNCCIFWKVDAKRLSINTVSGAKVQLRLNFPIKRCLAITLVLVFSCVRLWHGFVCHVLVGI